MSRQPHYDDLDEMLVPKDLQKAEKEKAAKKAANGKPQTQKERKADQKKQEQRRTILTIAVIFVVLLAFVIGVGVAMSRRVDPPDNHTTQSAKVKKAQPDPDKTAFRSESNIPALSDEGVKGLLKEAYYTVDGDLAVTLNLSNGTASKHKLAKVGIRIFNGDDETVAQQTIDQFDPECYVEAGGYGEVYFLINKEYVVLSNDPLSELGTTLEIGSIPTDAKATAANQDSGNAPVVGNGDKDIAAGRSFYENLSNLPALATDGIKATVIRARYTNDGSLAVTLSLSNGTDANQLVKSMAITIKNGGGDVIADGRLTGIDHTVPKGAYNELHLIIDKANVLIADDSLATLSTVITVNPGA